MTSNINDDRIFRGRSGPIVLVVLGLLLIVGFVRTGSAPTPEAGPSGSTYSTAPSGVSGFAELLNRLGYDVETVRHPLADRPPKPTDTLIIVNGHRLDSSDRRAFRTFLEQGGRLVIAGSTPLGGIVSGPPSDTGVLPQPHQLLYPFEGLTSVEAVGNPDGSRAWLREGSLLPIAGNADGTILGVERLGDGLVVAIADATMLSNEHLDFGSNSVLAAAAAGDPSRTVRFVEYVHGFDPPTGLGGLPTAWKQTLLVLAVAAVVWLAAHGVRLGPPEETARQLPPPRAAYVDALAGMLSRTKDPSATLPISDMIRSELGRRGSASEHIEDQLAVARRLGIDENMTRRALEQGTDREDLIARGTVLARLTNKEQL